MRGGRRADVLGGLLVALVAACGETPAITGPAPEPAPPVPPALLEAVRAQARPLTGAAADHDPLLALAADARFVLLGEQTHGTHEFYAERARISLRLFDERGFAAVALEGDFHSAERVHRYVLGESGDADPERALSGFERFPRWMWLNADFSDFVRAVRARNETAPQARQVGIYGLDLQSFYGSIDAVLAYLRRVDARAAERAGQRYACFDRYADEIEYARARFSTDEESCAGEAAAVLAELEQRYQGAPPAAAAALDSLFGALQNARVVSNGEAYFRAPSSEGWNVRDRHMAETLGRISAHLERLGRPGKVVVWAHNTHVGDARATAMGRRGEVSLGGLMRERHPGETLLVGFTTYAGTVYAAPEWGEPGRAQTLNPALRGSFADVFHQALAGPFLLLLRGAPVADPLSEDRLERAVGVIYMPQAEREAHYFAASLGEQFDAVIHVETTSAVRPVSAG